MSGRLLNNYKLQYPNLNADYRPPTIVNTRMACDRTNGPCKWHADKQTNGQLCMALQEIVRGLVSRRTDGQDRQTAMNILALHRDRNDQSWSDNVVKSAHSWRRCPPITCKWAIDQSLPYNWSRDCTNMADQLPVGNGVPQLSTADS